MEGMFRDLRRAFKVNGCIGQFMGATNGILQGCALSTILVNVIMTIWTKEVDSCVPPKRILVQSLPPKPPIWEATYDEEGRRVGRVELPQPAVDPRPLVIEISTVGYCGDCYAMSDTTKELGLATSVTEGWLTLTGQEINAKKSVVFVSGAPALPAVQLQGVPLLVKGSFKSPGVEVVPEGVL